MLPQLLKPSLAVQERLLAGDVVDDQRTDSTTVVPAGRKHGERSKKMVQRLPCWLAPEERGDEIVRASAETTHAAVMALYRSCPAVSQICALIRLPSVSIVLVANCT